MATREFINGTGDLEQAYRVALAIRSLARVMNPHDGAAEGLDTDLTHAAFLLDNLVDQLLVELDPPSVEVVVGE